MPVLAIRNATKRFASGVIALDDLTLNVADGELLTIVGPSGSGKTTLLRAIAGLERLNSGLICLGDTVLDQLAPRLRDVAVVFQQPALYPNLRVHENIAFPLRMRKRPKSEIDERIAQVSENLNIGTLLNRLPDQLSGGQAQRVALARALVRQPKCLLLDEPLSNLDAPLADELRALLKSLHTTYAITTLHVTHNREEALQLGNRVAVLGHGKLQQIGTPSEIVRQPANDFVANFFRSVQSNVL